VVFKEGRREVGGLEGRKEGGLWSREGRRDWRLMVLREGKREGVQT